MSKIVVIKSERKLLVFSNWSLIQTYAIAIGKNPTGKKQLEGDNKTPEGLYFINSKNPKSVAHKSIGISYPNNNDIANAKMGGGQPGGNIKIHGLMNKFAFVGKFHRYINWTNGCIGLTNDEIDDLYQHVPIGTPVEIRP